MHFLRQSTAVDVLIGPFVDITDGATAETGESPAVKLSKNGQTLAAKNDVTTPVHDANGYYNCEFDATDVNTVGTLRAIVPASATALPVWHDFQVMDEDAYDALFETTATILDAGDVSMVYKSDISTVTSQTEFIMVNNIVSANVYQFLTVSIFDLSTGEYFSTWITSVVQTTETIIVNAAPPFTVVAGDIVRVFAREHPRASINNYAPSTAAALSTLAANVRAWFRLITRKDAGPTTDDAAELSDLNANDGAGAGSYSNATDSLEANRDATTALSSDVAVVDANVDAVLVDTGTTLDTTLGTVNTNVTAIKSKTDQFSFGVANTVDANITNVAGGTDLVAAGTGSQAYGET